MILGGVILGLVCFIFIYVLCLLSFYHVLLVKIQKSNLSSNSTAEKGLLVFHSFKYCRPSGVELRAFFYRLNEEKDLNKDEKSSQTEAEWVVTKKGTNEKKMELDAVLTDCALTYL